MSDPDDTKRLRPPKGFIPPKISERTHTVVLEPPKSFWAKIKNYVYAFGAGVLTLIAAVLLWRAKDWGPTTLSESLKVQKDREKIAKLQAEKDKLRADIKYREPEVAELDVAIAASKKRIVEVHESAEGLSDDEAEAAFDRLGY